MGAPKWTPNPPALVAPRRSRGAPRPALGRAEDRLVAARMHGLDAGRYTDGAMAYNAWFQCINGCPGEFDLREVIYRCPTCGDLLEVQHDMEALRSRSAAAWMHLFDDRPRRNMYPYGSGVWSKKEWVVPFLDNENIVSMYEGNSNLLWADRYGKKLHVEDLWIKQSGNSHNGSFKGLGMTVLFSLVKEMMAGGTAIDAVACASTGDTSA